MPPRRAIRTVLASALLGALATVLTSWAIQAKHGWPLVVERSRLRGWQHVEAGGGAPLDPSVRLSERRWRSVRRLPPEHAWAASAEPFNIHLAWTRSPGWRGRREMVMFKRGPGTGVDMGAEQLVLLDAGWPLPAMSLASYTALYRTPGAWQAPTHSPPFSLHGGVGVIPWIDRRNQPRHANPPNTDPLDRFALPLLPIWPGFLLNTCFYAILTFALIRTPRLALRARRRRRGRCKRCGYDRAGLDAGAACPECGAGAPARRSRAEVA
ncbi:MAG: hypothetical protein KIT54_09165 [Phycisphaeraceae bacterium]|nr:hypothetical protein [Phycisphaeraceae bacterium]